MKVFLTGGAGFIGVAIMERLVNDNNDVTALYRKKTTSIEGARPVVADFSNLTPDRGIKFLKGVDVVIHAAARAHIMSDEAVDPLAEYRSINRDATLRLAELAAESGVERFIFISSVKVNGESTMPGSLFESRIEGVPVDPYGLSKYEAEQGLLEISRQTGMEVVIIRPPLVYGPNVKGNFASMRDWVKRGIPLPLGRVFNQRSFVALDNLVDFVALCADRKRSPKAANEVFLVSDGEDVSISVLLRKLSKAYGVKPRLLFIPVKLMKFAASLLGKNAVADRLFGNLQVDSTKAQDLLGWKPVVTMDEQLQKMAEAEIKSDGD